MIRRIVSISSQVTAFFLILLFISAAFADEHCGNPVARLVSVQGDAQFRQASQTAWLPAELDKTFCAGDVLRVGMGGRAAVVLNNDSILRIDQNSTLNFGDPEEEFSLLNLIQGVLHIFSHRPRSLKVSTPYVNGMVEGTEFLVSTDDKQSFISVFEGLVRASNEFGTIEVGSGQAVMVQKGNAPVYAAVVSPRDAVKWTLYYPVIWDAASDSGDEVSRQLAAASDYLAVGRVDEARNILEQYLDNGDALALLSIIEVVQNNKEQALSLAEKAIAVAPQSAAAGLALSYARQAVFDLEGALAVLLQTAATNPDNSQVIARLSELQMSVGLLDEALATARRAEQISPDNGRAQAVLGFSFLANVETDPAESAFNKAVKLDQAMPLARLGLGLTQIRQGNVEEGRSEIEVAAALDPGSSLIRSYLGKAYFEEKREKLASRQYGIAKELDTADPTPWFYDAILKQTENSPVEALKSIQKSIDLNDNRAVYRSSFMLDDDLASRSASLGRIYQDLGFEQLALTEGWKSVANQPGNFSAHRFLSDSYRKLPRHEIARLSELLQSQLLQPLSINPVQPQLARGNLTILEGAGPGQTALNEYNSLFLRNRFALQASGTAGSNGTFGDELVHSAVWNKLSYSIGQYYYETDGIRENNDQQYEMYNAYVQGMISPRTSWMFEVRYGEDEFGDLTMVVDPAVYNYSPTLRQPSEGKSARIGFRHDFLPHSTLIGTAIVTSTDSAFTGWEENGLATDIYAGGENISGEIQHIYNTGRMSLQSGIGYVYLDEYARIEVSFPFVYESEEDTIGRHGNIYSYAQIELPYNIVGTIGLSGDLVDGPHSDREEINPKLGLTWQPTDSTLIRGAVFKTLERQFLNHQTIEPTHVAGFNQFFDDARSTDAWLYGIGVDQTLNSDLFGGVQFYHRDLDSPYTSISDEGIPSEAEDEFQEDIGSVYLYWTPLSCMSLGLEYYYEDFSSRDLDVGAIFGVAGVTNHRFSPQASFFHRSGLSARIQAHYVDQQRDFREYIPEDAVKGDQFWQVDLALSYRLPKRYGILSLGIKNLLDEDFNYIDTDPQNPKFLPDQQVLLSLTVQL